MAMMLVPGTRMYVAMLPQRGMGGTSAADADPSLYLIDASFVGGDGGSHTTITTGDHVWQQWSMLACNEANWGTTGYVMTADGLTCRAPAVSRDWSLSVLECTNTPIADHYALTLGLQFDGAAIGTGIADVYLMSEIRYLTSWLGAMCDEVMGDSGGGGHRPAEYVNCYRAHIQVQVASGVITGMYTKFGATYDGVNYPMSPPRQSPDTTHAAFVGQTLGGDVAVQLRKTADQLVLMWGDVTLRTLPLPALHPTEVAGGSVGFMVADRLGVDSLSEVMGSTPGRTVIRIKSVRAEALP